MEDKFAKIISVVFHPLLVPSFLTLILLNLNSYFSLLIPFDASLFIFALIFITTFVFPLFFILIIKRKGMIKSLQMESREERIFPFAIAGAFNLSAFYMIRQVQVPDVFYLFLLGSAIVTLVSLVITFYSKISVHMAGAGGLTGSLMGISMRLNLDLLNLIIIVIFLSGLIGFARLKLNAHKPVEIYSGFVCGIAIMIIIFLI
jgi:hypothetical protein